MYIPEGTVVDGRFRIGKMLGTGGMGAVYEAQQLDLDRSVAIKFLSEPGMVDGEPFERFQREARVLSQLQHKNVVNVYAFGKWQQCAYMVMERVRGVSLQEMLRPCRPLDFEFVIRLGMGVCQGLAAAHALSIVHRDLKPSNLLISDTGEVKIIDFGLAKMLEPSVEKQKLTDTNATVGSVLYMSPEQCRGEAVSKRSDVYSLGCVLHHCLRGEAPFAGDHSVVVMVQHTEAVAPRLPDPRMQVVVDTAMAKNPDDRYQSMENFAADLDKVARGATVAAHAKSSQAHDAVTSNKRRALAIPIAAGIAITACAAIAFALHLSPPKQTRAELQETYARLTKQIGTEPESVADNKLLLAHALVCEQLARVDKDTPALYVGRMDRDVRAVWANTAEKYEAQGKLQEARSAIVDELLPLILFEEGDQTVLMKKRVLEQLLRCDLALNNHGQWKSDTDAVRPLLQFYGTGSSGSIATMTQLANVFRRLKRDDIGDELENRIITQLLADPHVIDDGDFYQMQDALACAAECAHAEDRMDDSEKIYRLAKSRAFRNIGK